MAYIAFYYWSVVYGVYLSCTFEDMFIRFIIQERDGLTHRQTDTA